MCGDGFMDFIHRPKNKILWRLVLSKGPNRVDSSFLPLHSPEDGSRASFWNGVILIFLIFYSSDDG
jgi:hypothetical protein